MLTKEQLAYYLYLAPELIARGWEKEEFYQNVRDYTISVWGKDEQPTNYQTQWYWVDGTNHDLYSVQKVFGGLKGSQLMGHSIVPNLMMYEVANRDVRGGARPEGRRGNDEPAPCARRRGDRRSVRPRPDRHGGILSL